MHCLHPYDAYYTRTVAGTAYTDWVDALHNDPTAPDSVACEGDACLSDPVCDGCADGTIEGGICRWCEDWNAESP